MARTRIRFEYDGDALQVADEWAAEHGYRPTSSEPGRRTYRKGSGLLTAPTFLSVSQQGRGVELEAWVAPHLLARAFALFLVPGEMGLESGGVRLSVPRRTGRTAVNRLLERLGGPPIG